MAAYQENLGELEQLGVTVIGATVEDRETAARMAEEEGLSIPIAYGVTPESVEALGPWWTQDDRHGRYLQPMEFLLRRGIVLGSLYASRAHRTHGRGGGDGVHQEQGTAVQSGGVYIGTNTSTTIRHERRRESAPSDFADSWLPQERNDGE